MPDLFEIVDAQPWGPEVDPAPFSPWLGRWRGRPVGILNDPPGELRGSDRAAEAALHHVGSVQKILVHEVARLLTSEPVGSSREVGEQVLGLSYSPALLRVDDEEVEAETLDYAGLRFLFGADIDRFPLVLFRPVDDDTEWPTVAPVPNGRAFWVRLSRSAEARRSDGALWVT